MESHTNFYQIRLTFFGLIQQNKIPWTGWLINSSIKAQADSVSDEGLAEGTSCCVHRWWEGREISQDSLL